MFVVLLAAAALHAPDPALAIVVTAQHRPYRAPAVPDAALARMRGGVRLPNGIDVSLGIDIQTRVDGLLALHTVYASDGSNPGIRVFVDGINPVPVAPTTQTVRSDSTSTAPDLTVGRTPTGTTIVPGTFTPGTTVNLVNGDPSTWLSGEGQVQLPVSPNGAPVPTPHGQVTLATNDQGSTVTLRAPNLEIQQLVGQATGVVIANTANDRVIDTVSSVNVDLDGISPALMAGIFAAQRMVLDAIPVGGR